MGGIGIREGLFCLIEGVAAAALGGMVGHFLNRIFQNESKIRFPGLVLESGSALMFGTAVWAGTGERAGMSRGDTMTGEILQVLGILLTVGAAALVDAQEKRIPWELTAAAGFFAVFGLMGQHGDGLAQRITGMIGIGGLMFFAAFLSKGGLGGGDVKLMAVLGFFLGLEGAVAALGIAVLLAAGYSASGIRRKQWSRKMEVALGPFLWIGMTAVLLLGL